MDIDMTQPQARPDYSMSDMTQPQAAITTLTKSDAVPMELERDEAAAASVQQPVFGARQGGSSAVRAADASTCHGTDNSDHDGDDDDENWAPARVTAGAAGMSAVNLPEQAIRPVLQV